jgi:O-antigen/teichoic acid export membrane protein
MSDIPSALPASPGTDPAVGARSDTPGVFRNLFRDTLWQFAGAVSVSVVNAGMYIVAIRLLGRDQFGAFGLVHTAAEFCARLFGFGAQNTLMILAGCSRHGKKDTVVGMACTYLAATATATWLWVQIDPPGPGSWIMSGLSPDLGVVIILYTAMHSFFPVWASMLRGADRYRSANMLNLGWQMALASGVVSGICVEGSYVGALWGGALAMSVLAAGVTVIGVYRWGFRLPEFKSFVRAGSSLGIRSYVASVSVVATDAFGVFYLATLGDLVGVAAIVGCGRMAALLVKPARIVNPVLQGKVAGQASGEGEAKRVLQVSRLTFLFGMLAGLPLLLFVRRFTLLTLGDGYEDAVFVMVLILLAQAFRAHALPTCGFLMGRGCPMAFVVLRVAVLAWTVAGVVAFAPTLGAVGVALVQCVMSLVTVVVASGILAGEARSLKSVFVGNDWLLLKRLSALRNLFLHPKRA